MVAKKSKLKNAFFAAIKKEKLFSAKEKKFHFLKKGKEKFFPFLIPFLCSQSQRDLPKIKGNASGCGEKSWLSFPFFGACY